MANKARSILARNVHLLATKLFGDKYQGRLIEAGIKNGTVTRVLKGETSVGLDTLDELAAALKVNPCVLLMGSLDPDDMPVCLPKSTAAHAEAGRIMEEAMKKIRQSSSQ